MPTIYDVIHKVDDLEYRVMRKLENMKSTLEELHEVDRELSERITKEAIRRAEDG